MQVYTAQKLTLTKSVIDQILEKIKHGELKPGSVLPSERELVSMFGVSRSVIREAMQGLSMLGYIEIKPGKRSIIREPYDNKNIDIPSLIVLHEKENLTELFEVRKVIEVEIVGLACLRATPEDLEQIEKDIIQYEDAAFHNKSTVSYDTALHQSLARAAHNSIMLKILSSIRQYLKTGREYADDMVFGGNQRSVIFHRRIFERIKARDYEGARAAMLEHIIDVEEYTLGNMAPVEESPTIT